MTAIIQGITLQLIIQKWTKNYHAVYLHKFNQQDISSQQYVTNIPQKLNLLTFKLK